MRSAYCAASVRSCIAATSVRPDSRAQAVERARAPAAGGRCRARWSARRAGRSAPPARARARRRRAAARRPRACRAAARAKPRRSSRASARAAASRSRAPSLRERPEVRRAPEEHVLARRSSTAASTAPAGRPRRSRASSRAASCRGVAPSSDDRARRTGTSPAIARSSVVLPAPFGPISASHSPVGDRRASTPSTTGRPPSSTRDAARARSRAPPPRVVRSTSAKNGAPTERGDDADRDLRRRERRARDDVGEHEEAGAARSADSGSSAR